MCFLNVKLNYSLSHHRPGVYYLQFFWACLKYLKKIFDSNVSYPNRISHNTGKIFDQLKLYSHRTMLKQMKNLDT